MENNINRPNQKLFDYNLECVYGYDLGFTDMINLDNSYVCIYLPLYDVRVLWDLNFRIKLEYFFVFFDKAINEDIFKYEIIKDVESVLNNDKPLYNDWTILSRIKIQISENTLFGKVWKLKLYHLDENTWKIIKK